MISWSDRKKISYILSVTAFLLFLIALPAVVILYKPPSCTDGKQNQKEFGVDCGGPCDRLCKNQSNNLIINWQRAFEVTNGVYNLVAYVENPNVDSGIDSVGYHFKLYDEQSILIAERIGKTFVPPRKLAPVFEPTVLTGNRVPKRVTFTFDPDPVWKVNRKNEPNLQVTNQNLIDETSSPLIRATITNTTLIPVHDFDVMVIVYDQDNNARAASKTVVDSLPGNASATVNFSWPKPYTFVPARIEIIPKFYPDVNF